MKPHEQELRDLVEQKAPFTIIVSSGDRIRVANHDHIFLPPLRDEQGDEIPDSERSEFFQVYGGGRHFRFVAFASIVLFESTGPALPAN